MAGIKAHFMRGATASNLDFPEDYWGYYRFEEQSGFVAGSENGTNEPVSNLDSGWNANGKKGGCIEAFNGLRTYWSWTMAESNDFIDSGEMNMSFWVNSTQNQNTYLERGEISGTLTFRLEIINGNIRILVGNSAGTGWSNTAQTGSLSQYTNEWVHFSINLTTLGFEVFINGQSFATKSYNNGGSFKQQTSRAMTISSTYSNNIGGYLDELLMYKRKLTLSEVNEVMLATSA